jgi:hypothetical protein
MGLGIISDAPVPKNSTAFPPDITGIIFYCNATMKHRFIQVVNLQQGFSHFLCNMVLFSSVLFQ